MRVSSNIRIIAIALMLVLAVHTIAGFACSLSFDLTATNHPHSHGHQHSASPHHHEKDKGDDHAGHDHTGSDEDCCIDSTIRFEQLDKIKADNFHVNAEQFPLLVDSPVICFFNQHSTLQVSYQKLAPRWKIPPSPDIRILIQSFQI